MRQSSEWGFEDEGSDSLVILGPMDREGVGRSSGYFPNAVGVHLPK
jgi:hypothetical protein